jgi:multidrug efflux pump subunit AcrA (membrane-fusion protein)
MTNDEVRMRSHTFRRCFLLVTAGAAAALLAVAGGCRQPSAGAPADKGKEQPVRAVAVVKPERKTIRRQVGLPGVIQAFERTSILARVPGYVQQWNVDLGDPVQKGEVLAELWVPEMVDELKLKEEQVEQARKILAMAQAQVGTARARVQEAEAGLARAEATHDYWKRQSARFDSLVKGAVLDRQTQEETLNQYQSAVAAVKEAKAKIESARALQQEKEAARDKAEVDIRAAEAERRRQADLVGYARLLAPYKGIVTQRSINTGQFVQPATGVSGDVLYVVERTDVVRVFVSVPETDADWVRVGAPAEVRVQALQDQEFRGKVTRTARSLNGTTRTLLTEIDLPNPENRLRPGTYAYATIDAEWPDVPTLPASAVVTEGDVNVGYQTFCYLVENDRVKRTPIRVGARNDQLVEVLKKQVAETRTGEGPRWEVFTGQEEVVRGDLSGLKDGQQIMVKASGEQPPAQ